MRRLAFYFDYLSPFSRFAWQRLPELGQGAEVELLPVPMGSLFNHWGIKGPGEVAPKRAFMLKSCLRLAARRGWPFTTPHQHPFNSLYALRLSLKEVAGGHQPRVVAALWEAGWERGIDMGDPDQLQDALAAAGLPAAELYEKSFSREAREGLKANLARALEAGVFGVPSFVVEGELFWGHDSFPDLLDFLAGKDPLDHNKLAALLAAEAAAFAKGPKA